MRYVEWVLLLDRPYAEPLRVDAYRSRWVAHMHRRMYGSWTNTRDRLRVERRITVEMPGTVPASPGTTKT